MLQTDLHPLKTRHPLCLLADNKNVNNLLPSKDSGNVDAPPTPAIL